MAPVESRTDINFTNSQYLLMFQPEWSQWSDPRHGRGQSGGTGLVQ